MFGGFTVNDSMAQIIGRLFRIPVNKKPITILELTGLPTEIVNVVVSVLCRMTFDFALWGEGHVPVTLVCEEAHRYVPANASTGFEPAKRAIARIAKEGRKYGASLCIVTQRPAEIDPTILSQCNTVFALRMANDRDQQIVQSAIADTGSGLLEFLPALGAREAIAFGDGMTLPVRIKFDELPKHALPRSSTARFTEKWNTDLGDEDFLNTLVERWRHSGNPNAADDVVVNEAEIAAQQAAAHQAAAQAAFAQQAAAQQAAQAAVYAQTPSRQGGAGFAPQRATGYSQPAAPQYAPPPNYTAPQQPAYEQTQQGFGGGQNPGYAPQQPNFGTGFAQQQPAYAPAAEAFGQPQAQAGQNFMQAAAAPPRQASNLLRRATTDQSAAPAAGGLLKRPGGLSGLLRRRDPQ